MMKNTTKTLFTVCFLSVLGSSVAFGQDFVFNYDMKELEVVREKQDVKSHDFGPDIAEKLQLLKESYTYKEVNEISLTEMTVVEKPSIYKSVKKISKLLEKDVKKGRVSKDHATEQLDKVLNIALNIRYQDTQELEEKLWKIKDPEEIKILYTENIALTM